MKSARQTGAFKWALVTGATKSAPITSLRIAITDHRISRTQHGLTAYMDGDIQDMLDALGAADRRRPHERRHRLKCAPWVSAWPMPWSYLLLLPRRLALMPKYSWPMCLVFPGGSSWPA